MAVLWWVGLLALLYLLLKLEQDLMMRFGWKFWKSNLDEAMNFKTAGERKTAAIGLAKRDANFCFL